MVGDSDLVCRAIKLALRSRLKIDFRDMNGCGTLDSTIGAVPAWDLVIVAVTSENGEPIAELAEASLIHWIGKAPLLVISSRPFEPSPEFRISHLRFPFDPDQLCERARLLLQASTVAVGEAVPV